jgi:hypothetical protein
MVLLPGESATLHIFEERYKQLVSDCLLNGAHFGIPFVYQKKIQDFGIEVKINNVTKKYENGEMDIVIEGVRVFHLIEYSEILSPKLYGAGVIEYEEFLKDQPSHFLQLLVKEFLWISQQKMISLDVFENVSIYGIARLIDLSPLEKYELLKAKHTFNKELLLKPKIKLFIHLIKLETDLKSRFLLN